MATGSSLAQWTWSPKANSQFIQQPSMGKNNMNKEDKEENVAGFITEGDLALCGQLVEVKTYLKPKNGESGEEQGSVPPFCSYCSQGTHFPGRSIIKREGGVQ